MITTSLIVAFVLPLAAQIAIKSAMNRVWSSFNTLQLLTLLPLMTINFPTNVAMVFEQVEEIVHVKFIPKDKIFAFFFGESVKDASSAEIKDLVLEKAGFSKENLFASVFMVAFGLAFTSIMIALIYCIYQRAQYYWSEKYRNMVTAVKNKLMYNSVLRTFLQSYLSLCVSAVVSLNYAENALQGTTGLILLVLLVICPIGVIYTLTRKRLIPIDHPMTKAQLDSLYLSVETDGKPFALLYTPMFLVRRLIFAGTVVILGGSPLLQIFTTMHVSMVLILFYAMVWPMTDTVNNML